MYQIFSTLYLTVVCTIFRSMVSNITLGTRNITTVSELRPHIQDYVTIY